MKLAITLFLAFFLSCTLTAQTTATFEEFNLATDEFLNGSDGGGGFSNGNIFLPNNYNDVWQSWTGWAISALTDTQTPGFSNQYSAITGGGENGSGTYAVSYVAGQSLMHLESDNMIMGLFVTNGTYPYLSMLEGDGFAKKFGGEDGNDPDFFLLTVKGYLNGSLKTDSVDFYLADYRFSDNNQDYIVDEWTWVDLSSLGAVDSLRFTLTSSDVGQFGMNTPAYFCIDNVMTGMLSASNPAVDRIHVRMGVSTDAEAFVLDAQGRLCLREQLFSGNGMIHVGGLPDGLYVLKLRTEQGWISKKWIKN